MKKVLGVLILVGGVGAAVWCFTAGDKPEVQAKDFATESERNLQHDAREDARRAAQEQTLMETTPRKHASDDKTATLPVSQTRVARNLSREELEFFVAAQNEEKARDGESTSSEERSTASSENKAQPASITTQSAEFQEFVAMARELAAAKSGSNLRVKNEDGSTSLSPEAKALADKAVAVASPFLTQEEAGKLQELESNPEAMQKLAKVAGRVLRK